MSEENNLFYQWEVLYKNRHQREDISKWFSKYGPRVVDRDENGYARRVEFNVLIDNPDLDVYLIGGFNDWCSDVNMLGDFKLTHDEHSVFASINVGCVKHKDEYKFLVVNKREDKSFLIQDAAGVYFADNSNTVFWDFEDPTAYAQEYPMIDTFERSTKILQTDLPGLIVHFKHIVSGKMGHEEDPKSFYRFIATSGVIDEIKRLGFNTVQFLPFAQSIDGDNWKFRYLVPFQFAVQKNWGNPDDFAYMVDMFHKAGIAVIGDFVLGHLPHKDYDVFGQSWLEHGLHHWEKQPVGEHRRMLYMKEETNWGTMRLDFDNFYVREFFVSSCLHFLKYYRVDGFRIDNVDGIIRFGVNGDGEERPCGRTFLQELNRAIYSYNPAALVHYEAHYYYEDNAKMLVAPLGSDGRALGATCYNSSRMTYLFHTKYMFLASEEFSVWKFKHIADEKEWGKSNSTVADFHNHDAAAGLMDKRCTGAYAYTCMTELDPNVHVHAIGKLKVMEAIISFVCEGRTLDLLQTFLLQSGTFEHNSSIEWYLTYIEANSGLVEYKKRINELMDNEPFWPLFADRREFLNVDDENKVIVIEKSSDHNGKKRKMVVVVNTSAWKHQNYKVGVKGDKNYRVLFNSDELKYSGYGVCYFEDVLRNNPSNSFELLDREVVLSTLAPYGVIVLEELE